MGLLKIALARHIYAQANINMRNRREGFKKVRPQQGHSPFDARSVHSVREHGKMATSYGQ